MLFRGNAGVRFYCLVALALLAFGGVCALIYVRGTTVIAMTGTYPAWRHTAFALVTHWGGGWVPLGLGLMALLWRYYGGLLILSSYAVGGLMAQFFKRVVYPDADRPAKVYEHVLHMMDLPPDVEFHHHHSFPSGHTATAFAVGFAFAAWSKSREVAILMLLLSLLVGLSRMHLFQHFLEDVIAGGTVGLSSAWLVWWLTERRWKLSEGTLNRRGLLARS